MMTQYRRIKAELPSGALLLFRLGDFYEMFLEDAKEGAGILNVALTQRGGMPMCGIPHHAADNYIGKLLSAGRKVALCEQVEEARPGKLVERKVTQILSPGTHHDERLLAAERNNYLAAVCTAGRRLGLAVIDMTTGDFKATEATSTAELLTELERLRPAEIVHPAGDARLAAALGETGAPLNDYEDWIFTVDTAQFTLREHFGVATLDGFGLKNRDAATGAAGGALHYLAQHLHRDVGHLRRLACFSRDGFLMLDTVTLRNLEILEPHSRDAPANACLYGAVNHTATPMGARRLRDWLTQPLSDAEAIRHRQGAVAAWLDHPEAMEALRTRLREVRDLERTLTRLSVGTGNGRDLLNLRLALEQLPGIREVTAEAMTRAQELNLDEYTGEPLLAELSEALAELPNLVALIARALVDEPPLTLKEGGLIRDGFDAALDETRAAAREGKDWFARLQQEEIESTGIPSLKVRFNNVFGYFIEVTRTHLEKVPPHYVRKQTIANGERYITDELKMMEDKVLGAEERAEKREYELFLDVREKVLEQLAVIQDTAEALASLDVLGSFAEAARLRDYCRPVIDTEGALEIHGGRHPVLEQTLVEERFVPNDTRMNLDARQMALITGPNMAGKSTYIRQVALIALLAHTGGYVPAETARVGLMDRIFTRIGASDNLARGQSTFMVEMSETANILNHATRRSLVILDEIGRGTSTFDGLSLAWAIVEHLHQQIGARTLFATHYHEVTELAGRLPRVFNLNVAVREYNDQVVFLRQIVDGAADQSYGIQVARLAGVPTPVLERAKAILANLEEADLTPAGAAPATRHPRSERRKLRQLEPSSQMDLFTT